MFFKRRFNCVIAQPHPYRAFTLIELLVVIGIIAVLISILLATLSKARRQANTVVCESNLRQVGMGLALYINANNGYFPGPNTSGLGLTRGKPFGGTSDAPVQNWDWVSPTLGTMMNFIATNSRMNSTQIEQVRLQKYLNIMEVDLRCPENDTFYGKLYSGSPLPGNVNPHIMSYAFCSFFGFMPTGYNTTQFMVEDSGATEFFKLPRNYIPTISRIGNASQKIFAFEGARYWDTDHFDYSTGPYTPGLYGQPQANFHSRGPAADAGSGEPYTFGNFLSDPAMDPPTNQYKAASLRHNGKMNVLFFDGHVEQFTFLDALTPDYWAPKNATVANGGALSYDNLYQNNTNYPTGYVVK